MLSHLFLVIVFHFIFYLLSPFPKHYYTLKLVISIQTLSNKNRTHVKTLSLWDSIYPYGRDVKAKCKTLFETLYIIQWTRLNIFNVTGLFKLFLDICLVNFKKERKMICAKDIWKNIFKFIESHKICVSKYLFIFL